MAMPSLSISLHSLSLPVRSRSCKKRINERKRKKDGDPAIVASNFWQHNLSLFACVCKWVYCLYIRTAAYKVEVVNQNLNLTHAATSIGRSRLPSLCLATKPKLSSPFVFAICLFDFCPRLLLPIFPSSHLPTPNPSFISSQLQAPLVWTVDITSV